MFMWKHLANSNVLRVHKISAAYQTVLATLLNNNVFQLHAQFSSGAWPDTIIDYEVLPTC